MPYPPLAPLFFIHLHHFAATLTLRLVIITLVAAWLARALLSFKRAQSLGND